MMTQYFIFLSLSFSEVYAVIDLYGQCVQVSITSSSGPLDNSLCTSNITEKSFPIHSPGKHQTLPLMCIKKSDILDLYENIF